MSKFNGVDYYLLDDWFTDEEKIMSKVKESKLEN